MKHGHTTQCLSNGRVRAGLLLTFFTLVPLSAAVQQAPLQAPVQTGQTEHGHTFTLRHIFHRGTYRDPLLHKRLDVRPDHEFVAAYEDEPPEDALPPRLLAKSKSIYIERLADRRHEQIADHLEYSSLTGMPRVLDSHHWTVDEVAGPNTTDKETVINLAIMASNAYAPKYGEGDWQDVAPPFNLSSDFGWEGDGLRGHIFADEGNKTIVIALKGTSPAVFDGDGTTTRDKVNDNLFFSCCCGQGGHYFWRQACDCYASTYTCNATCLVGALHRKTQYYTAAIELFTNVTLLYPDSNTWVVGHSLGGAVSSLIGLTFGIPAVTFEAPGDDLAARRLGLPVPSHANAYHPFQQPRTGAVHFGHTADPIFMGTCNGFASLCTLGGYAMESQCHTGVQCVYDTVGDHGWRVGLGYHRIHDVINNVIKKYDHLPPCESDSECVDCFNWKFFQSNRSDSKPTTTKTTSTIPTLTRSTICKTPGWWGCRDDTITVPTPVITTTYTTTSCAKAGWFGCNTEVNVTVTTTTALPTGTTSLTTTCETPGWFGCYDKTTTTTTSARTTAPTASQTGTTSTEITTSTVSPTGTTTTSTTCKTPGWLGCYDKTTTTTLTTSTTASHTSTTTTCETPGFFWGCYDKTTTVTTTSARTTTITITPSTPAMSISTTCATPGFIWGCYDETSSYHHTITSPLPVTSMVGPTLSH